MTQQKLLQLPSPTSKSSMMMMKRRCRRLKGCTSAKRKLYGRDDQLRIFRKALDAAISCNKGEKRDNSQLLFVKGSSGTGKTSLVQEAFTSSEQHREIIFGYGKFELEASMTPFAAIVSCFTQILRRHQQQAQQQQAQGSNGGERLTLLTTTNDLVDFNNEDDFNDSSDGNGNNGENNVPSLSTLQNLMSMMTLSHEEGEGQGDEQQTQQRLQTGTTTSATSSSSSGLSKSRRRHSSSSVNLDALKFTLKGVLDLVNDTSTGSRPCVVVCCLDDLQWADKQSIELLEFLWGYMGFENVIFVGIVRDDEETIMDDGHPMKKWLAHPSGGVGGDGVGSGNSGNGDDNDDGDENNKKLLPRSDFQIINVMALNRHELQDMLMDLLHEIDHDKMEEFSNVIYRRTGGNIFHTLQILDFLQSKKLLEYSLTTLTWTWDVCKIREETKACDNVVKTVLAIFDRLSDQARTTLTLCSYLGYVFEQHVLQILHVDTEFDFTLSNKTMEELFAAGLLEKIDRYRIKFTHDKIFEAAAHAYHNTNNCAPNNNTDNPNGATTDSSSTTTAIITIQEEGKVQYNIAMSIWKHYKLEGVSSDYDSIVDSVIFLCTDHFNRGIKFVTNERMRIKLAELNLVAAKRAASASSFATAVDLLNSAKDLLHPLDGGDDKKQPWDDHYDLCLDVYNSLAEYAIGGGLLEVHESAAQAVFENSKSIEDSGRVYKAQLRVLFMQAKHDIYQDRVIDVLRKLGENIPDHISPRKVDKYLDEAKRLLQANTLQTIEALPATDDPKTNLITALISEALMLTSSSQVRPGLVAYMYHRLLEITLERGTTPLCATAFPGAWVCLFSRLSVDSLYEIGKWGARLVDKFQSDNVIRHRVLGYMVAMSHWKEPMQQVLEKNLQGFKLAMMAGDTMSAFRFINIYCYTYLYSGLPLLPLVKDLDNYCRLMESFGTTLYHFQVLPMKQAAKNLAGLSKNILVIHQDEVEAFRLRGWEGRHGEQVEFGVKMQLAFYTGDLKLATEMYEKLVKAEGVMKNAAFYPPRVFFFTLICIANFKRTKKAKYKKHAKEHLAVVKDWVVDVGAVNVVHKFKILEAEMKSLDYNLHRMSRSEEKQLQALYDEAIAYSSRVGFVQDAGLAAYLASQSFRDRELRGRYFDQALEFYRKWDAFGLVQHLQEHSESSHDVSSSTFVRSSEVSSSFLGDSSSSSFRDQGGPASSSIGRVSVRGRERYDESIVENLQKRRSSDLFLT